EAIEIATELMDKKVLTFAERETASKRNLENTSRTTWNQHQQQQQQHSNKRRNTGRVYTAAPGGRKQYGDPNPYALNAIITTMVYVLLSQKPACYECGVKGHYKRDFPKLKNNNNQGNQGGRNNALARVYAVGRTGTDPDANVVMELRTALQGHVTALQVHVTTLQGQQGLAGDHTQLELPEEAGGSA
nr:hypothetical protein [Tanacetum cinerariifolium]